MWGRDKATVKKLVDRLAQWDVKLYCTHQWVTYASVIPQDQLVQSKATTHATKRNHCRQRHWFGRFKRKSINVETGESDVAAWFRTDCDDEHVTAIRKNI
jgi:IS1 family transposase